MIVILLIADQELPIPRFKVLQELIIIVGSYVTHLFIDHIVSVLHLREISQLMAQLGQTILTPVSRSIPGKVAHVSIVRTFQLVIFIWFPSQKYPHQM